MRCYGDLSFFILTFLRVHTGLTTAAMAEALKFQKIKMMMDLHKNHNGSEFDLDELNAHTGNHTQTEWYYFYFAFRSHAPYLRMLICISVCGYVCLCSFKKKLV